MDSSFQETTVLATYSMIVLERNKTTKAPATCTISYHKTECTLLCDTISLNTPRTEKKEDRAQPFVCCLMPMPVYGNRIDKRERKRQRGGHEARTCWPQRPHY